MRIVGLLAIAAASAACLLVSACQSAAPATQTQAAPIVQPGAPGQPSQTIDAARAVDLSKVRFTSADVEFMQGMIGHHAQAVEMVELLKTRAGRPEMRGLGQRIELSQVDEITMMQEWLTGHGQAAPEQHAHHGEHAMMPGMLMPDQMTRLASAHGPEFDRLFLEEMIAHHQGAILQSATVKEQGSNPDVLALADQIIAAQKGEDTEMQALLAG